MRKKRISICTLVLLLTLSACGLQEDYYPSKSEGNSQFSYEGNYITPELTVDGLMNEDEWKNATEKLYFGEKVGSDYAASVQFYRGERALYAFFNVKDENLLTKGNNNGDDVTKSDSIELYIDSENDGSKQIKDDDFQINIGIHHKTRILIGRNGHWGEWNGLLDYEVKLNGAINDQTSTDTGYSIELMIPYVQTNMTKDSTFGFSLGHVSKYGTGATDYSWNPLIYNGEFIDPQSPSKYIVCQGNNFYMRGEEDKPNISLCGNCVNQKNEVFTNIDVSIKGTDCKETVDDFGKFEFKNINPNNDITLVFTTGNKIIQERQISRQVLRQANEKYDATFRVFDDEIISSTTFTGTIANLLLGPLQHSKINVNGNDYYTDSEGNFSFNINLTKDMKFKISYEGLKELDYSVDLDRINVDAITDLGEISLNHKPSSFSFGGNRGINYVDALITRTTSGIEFEFSSFMEFPEASHIEIFISTKQTSNGRTTSDYRFDFSPNGSINIVNFGEGLNNKVELSNITCSANNKGFPIIKAFIPYSFLGIEKDEIFGISAGMWSGKDWDGFSFNGKYVAPEYTQEYVRVGLDNSLYTSTNNQSQNLSKNHMETNNMFLVDNSQDKLLFIDKSRSEVQIRTLINEKKL